MSHGVELPSVLSVYTIVLVGMRSHCNICVRVFYTQTVTDFDKELVVPSIIFSHFSCHLQTHCSCILSSLFNFVILGFQHAGIHFLFKQDSVIPCACNEVMSSL